MLDRIGFGGMRGALAQALKLKRPRLEMRVGELIPAAANPRQRGPAAGFAEIRQPGAGTVLQPSSRHLNKPSAGKQWNTRFGWNLVSPPPGDFPVLEPERGQAFAHLLFSPVLLDALHRT